MGVTAKRFLALGELIWENIENEFFYFFLKSYAKEHESGRKYLTRADIERNKIACKIFRDAGQSEKEVQLNMNKMCILMYGQLAMMMGYNNEHQAELLSPEELMKMLGLQ